MTRSFISILGLVALTVSQHADTSAAGCVVGQVMLDSGRPAADATVLVVGAKRGAICDSEGNFRLGNVPPGQYALYAKLVGYDSIDTCNVLVLEKSDAQCMLTLRFRADEFDPIPEATETNTLERIIPDESGMLQGLVIEIDVPDSVALAEHAPWARVESKSHWKDKGLASYAITVTDVTRYVGGAVEISSGSRTLARVNLRLGKPKEFLVGAFTISNDLIRDSVLELWRSEESGALKVYRIALRGFRER